MTQYEMDLWNKGVEYIAGVDECGRGRHTAPVVACAVIFPPYSFVKGVKDSKKMTPNQREELLPTIYERALDVEIGIASVFEIDRLNIREATFLAMRRAINKLKIKPQHILVDGFEIPNLDIPQTAIIKGDNYSFSIGAASIVAKVYRDRWMEMLDLLFPQYRFCSNKGYATREHKMAIEKYGPTFLHRKTFRPVLEILNGGNAQNSFNR